ncbi:MAG: nickel-responsive transcriptional regulator NikR [Betaproteobacteria bacterium]|nr:nickel-responsive transcriptional regulator NikR [Betaproteobacteria bacterium]MBM3741048.1 nickel-responsive transcriptional regulator NikR [Acidobacteriota bacterium]
MERITISLDQDLAQAFDGLIRRKGYHNRSEAVRDMVRASLETSRLANDEAPYCVAVLNYAYNHHARTLAERITGLQHQHHDLVLSAMHVHLDHDNCLETVMLRGKTSRVRAFAQSLIAEPEVRHGQLNLIPVEVDRSHSHGHSHDHGHGQLHIHTRPRT